MTKYEIEAFNAILHHQNFSIAAQSLYITQPALSKRLQSLEKELNCKLFERSKGNKKIELTKLGERFISIANKWNALYDEALSLNTHENNQKLTISALDGIHTCLLAEPYQSFIKKSANVTIDMKINHSKDSYFFVEQESVDLGFIAECQLSKNTTLFPVLREKMYFISNKKSYPFANIDPLNLDMQKCVYAQWNFEIDTWFDSIFKTHNKPIAIIENMVVLGTLLEIDEYWSIVPASIAQYLKITKKVSIKQLTVPIPDRTIYGIINSNTTKTKAIHSFLNEVHDYALRTKSIHSLLDVSSLEKSS